MLDEVGRNVSRMVRMHDLWCLTSFASPPVHHPCCITPSASPLASSLLEQSTIPQLSNPRILAGFTLYYSHTLTLLHSHTLCCTLKTQCSGFNHCTKS